MVEVANAVAVAVTTTAVVAIAFVAMRIMVVAALAFETITYDSLLASLLCLALSSSFTTSLDR